MAEEEDLAVADLQDEEIGVPARDAAPAGKDAIFKESDELDLETVFDVPVEITVVLGQTRMPISELLQLGTGAVIELERKVGEPVDVYVNERLVARGEVVIVEDHIGITMTEIIRVDPNKEH
jgi:flagellar motor switch protein FliN/FliY